MAVHLCEVLVIFVELEVEAEVINHVALGVYVKFFIFLVFYDF